MSRPFRFKLEKILTYRQQLEDQAQLALANAQQEEKTQLQLLQGLEQKWQNCLTAMADAKNMTQADLWLWNSYKNRVDLDRQQVQNKIQKTQEQIIELRQALMVRATERRLLEKLRAKQAEEHVHNEQQQTQKEFDETATLRYGRRPD